MFIVLSTDRLGRWVAHLTKTIKEFYELNIDLHVDQQDIGTWKSSER